MAKWRVSKNTEPTVESPLERLAEMGNSALSVAKGLYNMARGTAYGTGLGALAAPVAALIPPDTDISSYVFVPVALGAGIGFAAPEYVAGLGRRVFGGIARTVYEGFKDATIAASKSAAKFTGRKTLEGLEYIAGEARKELTVENMKKAYAALTQAVTTTGYVLSSAKKGIASIAGKIGTAWKNWRADREKMAYQDSMPLESYLTNSGNMPLAEGETKSDTRARIEREKGELRTQYAKREINQIEFDKRLDELFAQEDNLF